MTKAVGQTIITAGRRETITGEIVATEEITLIEEMNMREKNNTKGVAVGLLITKKLKKFLKI